MVINFLNMGNSGKKGVSAIFAIMVLAIVLAIVLGLSAIIATQMKTVKSIGDSTISFYAADAGAEYMLKVIISGASPPNIWTQTMPDIGAKYDITVVCCNPANSNCSCPTALPSGPNCNAPRYCIQSVGTYPLGSANPIKRSILVEI
jgi:hypothetical protein